MSKTLTAADRSRLIRLASSMPVGSDERKAILAGLRVADRAIDKAVDYLVKAQRILSGVPGWGTAPYGGYDRSLTELIKVLRAGPNKKASASLKDVLRKWPEFAPEIQKELRGLRAALRGDPDFGRVSDALMQIQMRLEDDHRRDPAAFHARAPFNKALADFAKAEYEHKTGDKW